MVAISPVNAPVDPNHVAQGLAQNANPGIEGGIVDDPRTPEEGQVQPAQTKQVADKTDPMAPFNPQPTKTYDTPLSPQEESKFQEWKAKYAPHDSGADYDLRGAFKAGLTPDPATGHWPDTFKKPNHPSFSNESQYATGENAALAGHWDGDTFIPPAGETPDKTAWRQREEEGLKVGSSDPMAAFNPQPTPKAPIDPAPAAYQQRLAQGSTLYDNVKALSAKRGDIDPTLKEQAKSAWDKIAGGYSDSHSDDFWTRLMSVPKIGAGLIAGASLPFSVPISKADALLAQTPGGLFKPGDLETALMGLPAGEPAALVDAGAGQTSRIVTDPATGAMKGQVIGEFPPKPEDFTNAASNIAAAKGHDPAVVEQNLRDKWTNEGLHPAEVAMDAEHDAFLAHDLGAAANTEPTMPPLVSPMEQPLSSVGKLMQAGRAGVDKLIDIGTDIQAKLDPMSVGSRPAQAIATDVANTERRIAWDHARTDKWISDNFSPESRERMWNAIDEQSVAEQRGESTEHQGLATLEPHEQELVRALQEHSKRTWDTAREIGMVKGEGLPSYGPRIMINMLADVESKTPVALGRPISTRTSNMIARKYLTAEETEAAGKNITEGAQLIRDVRTLPLVTARMERAIMWHKAITKIEEMGATTGNNTVWSGPLAEGMDRKDWFTRPEPAFQTWQPLLERGPNGPILSGNMLKVVKNADGETMYERVPRYIHKDFQGPLDAIIQKPYGPALSALMNLKGKTMSLVMYSPVIHNLVEFSRSLPAVNGNPIKLVRLYFDGNAVKNNPAMMREAIDGGLVPIGKRFFNQDMFATAETPTLTPGRSWTAQIAGFFPEMYSPEAGAAVKRGIDAAGDFWHNTLLWDRVADLQAGLYKNFLDEFGAIPGIDRSSAVRASAHFANRFAGSLPVESMSRGARTVANVALFSRTFTMGNYALFKDALMGLPGNVGAQIERAVSPEVFRTLNTKAKRLAQHAIITDIALKYVTGSLLASGLAVMASDQDWGGALSEVYQGYVKRFQTTFDKATEHPLSILAHPFDTINSLTPMSENEPGKEDRIKLPWRMPDGGAMYATNPAGKIADQYLGSIFHPIDTLHNKLSTFARPVWDVLANDKGFGRKIFDPEYTDNAARFQSALDVAKIIAEAQMPTGQMASFGRLATGDGDAKFNDLQAFGPFFGTNVSKGAPGGEQKAVLYQAQQAEKFRIDQAMPDIKKAVQDGDNYKAREIMTGLGMSNRYQNAIIHYQSNPAKVSGSAERDLMRYGTQEEKDRFQMFKSQQ